MLKNIRIVLIEPSHPGNIGAAARAMKTMGLTSLYLVSPKTFPSEIATARAANAADVLEAARVVDTFEQAIYDCQFVYGSGSEGREHPWPIVTPRELVKTISEIPDDAQIAVVFGQERFGMSNEELKFCHGQIQIPTHPLYRSLNLASAVQIVCYELSFLGKMSLSECKKATQLPAPFAKREMLYQRIEALAAKTGYLNLTKPMKFPVQIRHFLTKVALSGKEVDILLGVLTSLNNEQNASSTKNSR
jgi:TrmH family RNA methyltransferase